VDTLGIIESKSIAAGVELADIMMKAANVELVKASTICSGRYMIYVSGERDAVQTSLNLAEKSGRVLIGNFILSNVSHQVITALKKISREDNVEAIGVVECRTASSGVAAADRAVKKALVCLSRLVTGNGINGKSYFVISGDVASVEEAVNEAKSSLGRNLIESVVIPGPDASVVKALTGAGK
jgi:microcompartment protein CcmL/EutN